MSADRLLVTLTLAEHAELVRKAVAAELDARGFTSASPAQPSSLLARSALAMQLSCSIATIDRMVRDGCPFVIVGRTKRFDMARVQAWLATRTIAPAAVAPKPTPVASLAGVRRLSRGASR